MGQNNLVVTKTKVTEKPRIRSGVVYRDRRGNKTYTDAKGTVLKTEERVSGGGTKTTVYSSNNVQAAPAVEEAAAKQEAVYVEDSNAQQSRKLSAYEAAGLVANSGGMTTAEGDTVYVTYEDEKKTSTSSSSSSSSAARDKNLVYSAAPERNVLQKVKDKLKSQVITPFKEGFTLAPTSEFYRSDQASASQEIFYSAGLVGSVATAGGAAGETAGVFAAKNIAKSGTALRITEKLSELSKTGGGKIVLTGITGVYAGSTAVSVAQTEEGDRVRKLFGVGRELSTFAGIGSGLKKGFQTVSEETTFLFKGKTDTVTATNQGASATAAKSEGSLYSVYKNRVNKVGDVLQVSKQKATTNELFTDFGQRTSVIEGSTSTSTELSTGKKISQASTETTFAGLSREAKNTLSVVDNGVSYETGTFQSRSNIASSIDKFESGVRSVEIEGSVSGSKGVFTAEKGVTYKEGVTSTVTNKVVSQAQSRELLFDLSGKTLPQTSGSSLQTESVLQSQTKGISAVLEQAKKTTGTTVKTVPFTTTNIDPVLESPGTVTTEKTTKTFKITSSPYTETKAFTFSNNSQKNKTSTIVSTTDKVVYDDPVSVRENTVPVINQRSGSRSGSSTKRLLTNITTPITDTVTDTDSRVVQEQKVVQKTTPETTVRSIGFSGGAINLPPLLFKPFGGFAKAQAAKPQGYSVQARIGGVFKNISNSPLSLKDAIGLGSSVVGSSPAATFRVSKSSQPIGQRFFGVSQIGDFESRAGGIFVEKREKRINTGGELAGITRKGQQAIKMRSVFKK